jgi:CrcB protein
VIQRFGNGFPYGTLLINLSGSFLLGLILPQLLKHAHIDPRLQLLISVGFLGSYTTFSIYAFQTIALISQGRWGLGIFYLIGSALLGAIFAILGLWLGNGF